MPIRGRSSATAILLSLSGVLAFAVLQVASPAGAVQAAPPGAQLVSPSPESAAWCTTFTGERSGGGVLEGWTGLSPSLPVCGPAPYYDSAGDVPVRLPEAYGNSFWSGTLDGFQCVELSDRWLAMAYGLNVVTANGDEVARNYYNTYHASHPGMRLIGNGTAGQAPKPGDVISFSNNPSFTGDDDGGHVAVVVNGGSVNSAGNGAIYIAQENVSGLSFTHQELSVSHWRVSGEGFAYVEWLQAGPLSEPGYLTAFQANTGDLWTAGTSGTKDWNLGMMKGTSPSITGLANGGYEVAFEANTTDLWTVGSAGNKDWNLGMMKGTSPSIAGMPGDSYEVAFQANTTDLWTVGSAGNKDWNLGMMKGTSPSITSLANGGYEVAFQANTGDLWTVGSAGNKDWNLGMMKGTSPSIAGMPGGSYEVAFQANTGDLWTVGSQNRGSWALGMMAGTSPSITT
jgi:hypothetical protein